MELIVDLHLHSHYSRATSKDMDVFGLYKWGKLKGIHILGTGDITHPAWVREVKEKLEPVAGGLFQLKREYAQRIEDTLPEWSQHAPLQFIPTVEISTIYSKAGKVRKIHQIVVLPDLETVDKLNKKLETIGNLRADGRPILGLDSKELFKIVMETSDQCLVIPAHIWTPWFGIFGSKSGFDSLVDAYEELSEEIVAVETGLSSDLEMNVQIKELRTRTITSHSDAHSPKKLGREATVVNCERNYLDIISAIKTNDERLIGTIEFYPEEGKYHYDGHRGCGVRFSPSETAQRQGICPVCGRPLTIGVLNRVTQLAASKSQYRSSKQVEYIIPLAELLAHEMKLKSVTSQRVQSTYLQLLTQYGDEFTLLRNIDLTKLRNGGFATTADSIERMRRGEVVIEPGYDGVYGTIAVSDQESPMSKQLGLGI